MIKKVIFAGSALAIVAVVFLVISGQYLAAAVVALVGVYGFWSELRSRAADEIMNSEIDVPQADELKEFRKQHPELSFSEAILAMQKGGDPN